MPFGEDGEEKRLLGGEYMDVPTAFIRPSVPNLSRNMTDDLFPRSFVYIGRTVRPNVARILSAANRQCQSTKSPSRSI